MMARLGKGARIKAAITPICSRGISTNGASMLLNTVAQFCYLLTLSAATMPEARKDVASDALCNLACQEISPDAGRGQDQKVLSAGNSIRVHSKITDRPVQSARRVPDTSAKAESQDRCHRNACKDYAFAQGTR